MQTAKVLAYMITAGRNIVISTFVAHAFVFFHKHPTKAHQKNASRLQFESPKRIRGLQKDVDVILPKPLGDQRELQSQSLPANEYFG